MYTLKVNSTRNFNIVRHHFLCSFALYLLMLVPPAFVRNCRRKPSNICLPSHSVITEIRPPISSPPKATASYFTTLKSTVDLDGRFLVLHSSHRAECFLYLYTATAVCRSTWCSGLDPPFVTRLSGPSHYPRAPSLSVISYKPEPETRVLMLSKPVTSDGRF